MVVVVGRVTQRRNSYLKVAKNHNAKTQKNRKAKNNVLFIMNAMEQYGEPCVVSVFPQMWWCTAQTKQKKKKLFSVCVVRISKSQTQLHIYTHIHTQNNTPHACNNNKTKISGVEISARTCVNKITSNYIK